MKINQEKEIELPNIPNYFLTKSGTEVFIHKISAEDLQKIGEEWTRQLISKANNHKYIKIKTK